MNNKFEALKEVINEERSSSQGGATNPAKRVKINMRTERIASEVSATESIDSSKSNENKTPIQTPISNKIQ